MIFPFRKNRQGGILITTVLIIAMMSMLTAATLYRVSSRHAATYQSLCWQESLSSAEAGADLALVAMNKSISSPTTAWTGWVPNDATTFPKTLSTTIPNHIGEGNNKVFAKVVVDKGVGGGWIRVRSTGVAELPGSSVNGIESARTDTKGVRNHLNMLRKASFRTDVTGGLLRLPQVSRTIEVVASPPSAGLYIRALLTANEIKLISPLYVDSFDSTNSTKSTNGEWVLAKRQSNGDIASISAGGISTLNNCFVWGDASCNTGAMSGTTNVQGSQYNNFSTPIADVAKPVFSTINSSYTAITNPSAPVTLTGGAAGSAVNYKLTDLTVSDSSKPVILAPHVAGQESYINIWVTGNTTLATTGKIVQQAGVHVKFYSEGSIVLGGGGWVNQTKLAKYLQVYGVTPAVYSTKDFRVTAGTFIGIFNGGKTFDLTISGTGTFIGAAIGREADYSGSGAFHYDEDLGNFSETGTASATYKYASWAEDIR